MKRPLHLAAAHASGSYATLIAHASIEISARDAGASKALADTIPRGAHVHVTFHPTHPYTETVAAAHSLVREGFVPVPHVAARSFVNEAALADYVARLTGEAGVKKVLLIGGDLDSPRGPYADCLSIIETGALQRHGIQSVAFAGHPEGHPAVDDVTMTDALRNKIDSATGAGLASSIITQLCFEAPPILDWLARIRRVGISAPVAIGAAAPTSPANLMKFAVRCGVGPSMRALTTQTRRLGKLLTETGPERLLTDFANAVAQDRESSFGALASAHFFVFGSVKRTAEWLASQQRSSVL